MGFVSVPKTALLYFKLCFTKNDPQLFGASAAALPYNPRLSLKAFDGRIKTYPSGINHHASLIALHYFDLLLVLN
jgi:hypothetical protein